jgi:ankyrin repeat protein
MLDANVDVNSRDDNGNSLLIVACQQGNKSIAKLLLRRGADINAQVINIISMKVLLIIKLEFFGKYSTALLL